MAQHGAFDGLDAAMMVHPAGVNLVTMPSVAMNEVRVTFTGKAAHASAMPFAGVNALDALVSSYQSIAQLRQHIRQNERIHGIFNEAGLAPNIVPDRAVGTFYVRAAVGVTLADLKKRVKNCFKMAHWPQGASGNSMGAGRLSGNQVAGRLPSVTNQCRKPEPVVFRLRKFRPPVPVRPIWAMSAMRAVNTR